MIFDEVKKLVREIDYLQDKVKELESDKTKIQMQDVIKNIHYSVELENNTKVLIDESTNKMLEELKHLLEYEIGERMKKLNINEK